MIVERRAQIVDQRVQHGNIVERSRVKARFILSLSLMLFVAPDCCAANGSVSYTYDALGRVTTASYDTGIIVIYSYDASSNRTQQVINVNTTTVTWSATSNPCSSNCWGATLW